MIVEAGWAMGLRPCCMDSWCSLASWKMNKMNLIPRHAEPQTHQIKCNLGMSGITYSKIILNRKYIFNVSIKYELWDLISFIFIEEKQKKNFHVQ